MSQSINVRELEWDSQMLGIPVARLDPSIGQLSNLGEELSRLRTCGFTLVYVSSDEPVDPSIVKKFDGLLVDMKTTFGRDLKQVPQAGNAAEQYANGMNIAALENLALQSGEYSRFRIDPRIPPAVFEHLYKVWLHKSLTGELADQTMIVRNMQQITGFVTLKAQADTGEIGLIAVAREFRGQGFGEQLMQSAFDWFVQSKASKIRVITQGANQTACRFYEKFGFNRFKLQFFYHFWLRT